MRDDEEPAPLDAGEADAPAPADAAPPETEAEPTPQAEPESRAPAPAAEPEPAESAAPPKLEVTFNVIPLFLTSRQAGRYLGHSAVWIWKKAKEHKLFQPSVQPGKRGGQHLFHRDHLEVIARHMCDPENYTADMALTAWKGKLRNGVIDDIEAAAGRPARRRRDSGGRRRVAV